MKPTEYKNPLILRMDLAEHIFQDCLEELERHGYELIKPITITQDELDDRSSDANDLLKDLIKQGMPIHIKDYEDE